MLQIVLLGSLYLILWRLLEQVALRVGWQGLKGVEHYFASLILILILTLSFPF